MALDLLGFEAAASAALAVAQVLAAAVLPALVVSAGRLWWRGELLPD